MNKRKGEDLVIGKYSKKQIFYKLWRISMVFCVTAMLVLEVALFLPESRIEYDMLEISLFLFIVSFLVCGIAGIFHESYPGIREEDEINQEEMEQLLSELRAHYDGKR